MRAYRPAQGSTSQCPWAIGPTDSPRPRTARPHLACRRHPPRSPFPSSRGISQKRFGPPRRSNFWRRSAHSMVEDSAFSPSPGGPGSTRCGGRSRVSSPLHSPDAARPGRLASRSFIRDARSLVIEFGAWTFDGAVPSIDSGMTDHRSMRKGPAPSCCAVGPLLLHRWLVGVGPGGEVGR